MKLVKQLSSMLLAMVLAFGLLLPAAHAEEGEVVAQEIAAQAAPVITITKQPEAFTKTLTGKEITLSIEAKIPEGVDGTLRYQWYQVDSDGIAVELKGETAAVLRLRLTYEDLRNFKPSGETDNGVRNLYYHVTVTCDYAENGQEKSISATSKKAEIFAYFSLRDYLFKHTAQMLQQAINDLIPVPEDDPLGQGVMKAYSVLFRILLVPIMLILYPIVVPLDYMKYWRK